MMRFLSMLAVACIAMSFAASARAQSDAAVRVRINDVTKLISQNPGGFDTLFTESFRAAVPSSEMTSLLFKYYNESGPVAKWKFIDSTKPWQGRAQITSTKGYTYDITIELEKTGSHRLSGFFITPAKPPIKDFEELVANLGKLVGSTGFFAGRLIGNSIEPIVQYNQDTTFALGSAFKLFILSDLVRHIAFHMKSWSDVVTLDSVSRSLPSGMMHAWPVGTPVTLGAAAAMMISISDNTATDLLLRTLSAGSVESAIREAGGNEDRNRPLLTTLEMFKLKSNEGRLAKEYLPLDMQRKREFLTNVVDRMSRDSVDIWSEPRMIDSVEWFATPREMANVLKWLYANTQQGEPALARKILAVNPGLPLSNYWKYIGYKGGSEPGVLTMNYLLQAKTGEWYVVTGAWNNPDHSLKDEAFEALMERGIELLEK